MDRQPLSQKIVEAINQRHLKPKPRWEFVLKDWAEWVAFIGGLGLGGLATAVVIFVLSHSDWTPAFSLPLFWLLVVATALILAVVAVRQTQRGYRYRWSVIVAASFVLAAVIGGAVYAVGGAESVEESLYQHLPPYRGVVRHHLRVWQASHPGEVIGLVEEFSEQGVVFRDLDGRLIIVPTTTVDFHPGQRIFIRGRILPDGRLEPQLLQSWFHDGRPPLPGMLFNLRLLPERNVVPVRSSEVEGPQ